VRPDSGVRAGSFGALRITRYRILFTKYTNSGYLESQNPLSKSLADNLPRAILLPKLVLVLYRNNFDSRKKLTPIVSHRFQELNGYSRPRCDSIPEKRSPNNAPNS
jgi:hypothetical protein